MKWRCRCLRPPSIPKWTSSHFAREPPQDVVHRPSSRLLLIVEQQRAVLTELLRLLLIKLLLIVMLLLLIMQQRRTAIMIWQCCYIIIYGGQGFVNASVWDARRTRTFAGWPSLRRQKTSADYSKTTNVIIVQILSRNLKGKWNTIIAFVST